MSRISFPVILFLTFLLISPQALFAGAAGSRGIEQVAVQPPGGLQFSVGASYEKERKLTRTLGKYDNARVHPFELKYGFTKQFELGLNFGYSANSSVEGSDLDESGMEGAGLSIKYNPNNSVSITAGAKMGDKDNVYPYGNEDTDYWLNVPFKVPSGPGAVLGEVGYTLRTGEAVTVEHENYFNYGIGYHFVVSPWITLRSEIVGHDETVNTGESSSGLLLGMNWKINRGNIFKPAVSFGVDDGKSSYAFALEYVYKFGDRGPKPIPVGQRFSQASWFKSNSEDTTSEETIMIPKERESTPETSAEMSPGIKSTSDRKSKQALQLVEEGLRAYRADDFERAENKMKRALELDPENTEILANLAAIYYYQDKYEQARKTYRRVLDLAPDKVTARIGLGAAHYELGQSEKARAQFERALELAPNNDRAQDWLDRLPDK